MGGEAPLAKIVAGILLDHHLPDNPHEQNQIDAEYFSHGHDRHVDLLNFASFVRKNYTRETEMEEATIKLLVQVVSTGVDIWEEDGEAITKKKTPQLPNSETISVVAIYHSLQIRNLLKLV